MESNVSQVDWPKCGQCGTTVENFYVLENADLFGTLLMVAECHGETEKVEIPERILADADPNSFQMGTAFNEGHNNENLGTYRRFT